MVLKLFWLDVSLKRKQVKVEMEEFVLLKIYVEKNNSSSRKLIKWLKRQKIDYEERYIDTKPLSEDELLNIMSFTENGFDDLFSYRAMKDMNLDEDSVDSLSVKELVRLMVKNPRLIRKPFAIKGKKMIVGYGKDQVQTLIPKERRLKAILHYQFG